MRIKRITAAGLTVFALSLGVLLAHYASAQTPLKYPDYPSETPEKFVPPTSGMDHESREVMIPMRDGVKLRTVILVPKGADKASFVELPVVPAGR